VEGALGLAAAALLPRCNEPSKAGSPLASSSKPEIADLRFGITPLTDSSPLVIAHERGLFKKYGLNSTIAKGVSSTALRDSLSNGGVHAMHTSIGMALASTMGLLGSTKRPLIIPWVLNRNGQAISLARKFKGKITADPRLLKLLVDEARKAGQPRAFATDFHYGSQAIWLRFFLGAGGIDPDDDVSLVNIPPPQLAASMKRGEIDGFCAGEPWNARAIADDAGYTAVTTQDLWRDHPDKVCAFGEAFAQKNPKAVKAVLKALHEASIWLDDLENRPEQAAILSRSSYLDCPPELVLARLKGEYDYGDGRKKQDPNYMIFHERNCNYPAHKYAKWWLTQFRRWGMVEGKPAYDDLAKQVMRTNIYEEAMNELGVAVTPNETPETPFDGITFDPKDPEKYATGFAVHDIRG
jgi:nitrate/nitrite transport system substrate-binding protein